MELKYGDILVESKILKDLGTHIARMNEHDLCNIVTALHETMDALELDRHDESTWVNTYFKAAWDAIDARYASLEEEKQQEIDAGVAAGKYIQRNGNVYVRDANALIAIRALLGAELVNEVFVDRLYLENLRRQTEQGVHEKIIALRFNHDEEAELSLDGMNMVIEFTNGRRIELTNSEWGWMTRIK